MAAIRLLSPASVTLLGKLISGYEENIDGQELGFRVEYHGQLEDLFGDANLEVVDRETKSISTRTRETLRRANDNPSEHESLKRLIEHVVDPRRYQSYPERNEITVEWLNRAIRLDGFELRMRNGQWRLCSSSTDAPVTGQLDQAIGPLDFDSTSENFARALDQAEQDPEDAITAACSMVESVCKCILDELDEPYPGRQDIKSLVRCVGKKLHLDPARDDLPKECADDIRQILGGLQSVAGGIGALRTHTGDAHGRGKKHVKVDARIARLAIHAASTISLFFIETWGLHYVDNH